MESEKLAAFVARLKENWEAAWKRREAERTRGGESWEMPMFSDICADSVVGAVRNFKPEDSFIKKVDRYLNGRFGGRPSTLYGVWRIPRSLVSELRTADLPVVGWLMGKMKKRKNVSREMAYRFIFALRLNYDEGRALLSAAGYSFRDDDRYDFAIQECLRHGIVDFLEVNEVLRKCVLPMFA